MATIIDRCKGKSRRQVQDEGLLSALVDACGGERATCSAMGWHWNQHNQRAIREATGGAKTEVLHSPETRQAARSLSAEQPEDEPHLSDVARGIHNLFQRHPGRLFTPAQLSEETDRSETTVLRALDEIRQACFEVHLSDTGAVKLQKLPPSPRADYTHPGWGEVTVRIGVISDVHMGNICCMEDELEAVYDRFAAEGVTAVLCAGDTMDGPGDKGFPGHAAEVREDCQTAVQQVRYTQDTFPRRKGLQTYIIDSAKSHIGWEFARTGFNMARALCEGFPLPKIGRDGDYLEMIPGREDITYLGLDDRTLRFGPELNTKVHLHHPDGGSAYAISYQPQKWVESLDGGDKPHIAFLGHYHKATWLPVRNVQLMSAPCMCWQTPFMKRKRLAAHVGALIVEWGMDTGGDVRRFRFEHLPFYKTGKRAFVMGQVA